jgi:poly [ADP-ribose] polymerase
MLTFYPEFEAAEDNEIEVILILDLSNSMKGKALLEAKKVLLLTLKVLCL